MKQRRLCDLYVRGKEITVDDGSNDPVTVWIQKLNEIERDSMLRRANAAKARYTIECDDESSEAFVSAYGTVRDYLDVDRMIAVIIAEEVAKAQDRFESQMLHDEEGWGKDGRIQNLVDAWTGDGATPGLAAAIVEDPNDPEAVRVKAEIDRYEAELRERVEHESKRLSREWEDKPLAELAREATRALLKRRADDVFLKEWSRQQIFYCVRDVQDKRKRYFSTVAEVDDLDDQIREFLDQKCNALFVSMTEGKDSPPAQDSSTSSEAPTKADPSARSGQEAVSA